MSERLVIDCLELWERQGSTPDGFVAVHEWMLVHGIEPGDVPVHSEMVIEDSAFGMVIRYVAYLTNADGRKYADPDDPDRIASEARTALLRLPPPADWVTTAGGAR